MEYISKSKKETFTLAKKIASESSPGDILALSGDLGSGKTTFVKGFAKALGIKQAVTSPTFVIIKQYPITNRKNILKYDYLIHVDCYRINSEADVEMIGLKDLFKSKNSILLIEWPEKISEFLPEKTRFINFEYIDSAKRKIIID